MGVGAGLMKIEILGCLLLRNVTFGDGALAIGWGLNAITCNTFFAGENVEIGEGGIWGGGTCNSFLSLMMLWKWWIGDWGMQLLTSLV